MPARIPEVELQRLAARALQQLQDAHPAEHEGSMSLHVSAHTRIELPSESVHMLIRVLTHLSRGHGVTVLSSQAQLTTQEAADILCVSRPHLVSLLERGEIPFHRVGRHRRVRAEDLQSYKDQKEAEQLGAAASFGSR